ncbi:MAG: hypothetical protein IJ390_08555 [Lachnospiraceae bacterium]|nr:hypothetical protein [Lachnospiraceae bacterium]
MNTIKVEDKKQTLMIAHRGVSGLETENTNAAFVAAGNRSYFGVETDIHKTVDNNFVIIHDDTTKRVAIDNLTVEESTYDTLRGLVLLQKDGKKGRTDLRLSNLEEYIGICKHYEKTAVLELKNHMEKEDVYTICGKIEEMDYLEHVIFISFDLENLIALREKYPSQPAQYLLCECKEADYENLLKYHLDLDILYRNLPRELVERCHANGIKVNCWTCDDAEEAKRLISYGVDFITSNILE